jgi:diacylglycerol kinase (ATP)
LLNSLCIIMKKNIALLCNPTAANGKSLKLAQQLLQMLETRQMDCTLFTTGWPLHLSGFTEAWLVGGDGTLNYALNHYAGAAIPFALFKGGTGNDFAWKLYGNCTVEEQFERVLQATPKAVDAALCNATYFINGVGIGFDGEVLRSMGAIRWLGGHIGYLLVVMKKILSFREKKFRISTGNAIREKKFLLVMVSNSSRTGGGFHVSPQASITDGLLNLVLCDPLPVLKRFRWLPVIEKGKHLSLPFIHHETLQAVTIECTEPTYAQLDGELICEQVFTITILPGRFLFCY